jgi:hypothetical protein
MVVAQVKKKGKSVLGRKCIQTLRSFLSRARVPPQLTEVAAKSLGKSHTQRIGQGLSQRERVIALPESLVRVAELRQSKGQVRQGTDPGIKP